MWFSVMVVIQLMLRVITAIITMIMKTVTRNVTTLQPGNVLWTWKQNLSTTDVGVRWRWQFCHLIPTSRVPIG